MLLFPQVQNRHIFHIIFGWASSTLYNHYKKQAVNENCLFFFFFLFFWWATLEPLYCGDHHQTNTPMAFSATLISHHVIYSLFLGLTECDTGGAVLEVRWAMAGSPCPIHKRKGGSWTAKPTLPWHPKPGGLPAPARENSDFPPGKSPLRDRTLSSQVQVLINILK